MVYGVCFPLEAKLKEGTSRHPGIYCLCFFLRVFQMCLGLQIQSYLSLHLMIKH